jgi:hypothetical protein
MWDVIFGRASARLLARLATPLDPEPVPSLKFIVP